MTRGIGVGPSFSLMILLTLAVLSPSCAPEEKAAPTPPPSPLRISGAEVALPFVQALCDGYAAANPGVSCNALPPASSRGGLNGVASGDLDIAAVSRPLTAEEKDLGLREVWIALDPLVLVSHHGTLVESLSRQQVRDIYAGRVTNWKAIGGADERIVIVDRPESTSGKIAFREHVLGSDLKVAPGAIVVAKSDEVHGAILSDPGAIGYTSLGLYLSEKPDLSLIRLDGIYPDEDSVRARAYTAVRPFGIAFAATPRPEVEAFAAFATSPAGTSITRQQRLYPR